MDASDSKTSNINHCEKILKPQTLLTSLKEQLFEYGTILGEH